MTTLGRIMIKPEEFFNRLKKDGRYNTELIELAYDFAEKAHKGQKRKSGEDYIQHPLAIADMLASMRLDETTIIAALLHDVPEDTKITLSEVEQEFGKDVAKLVAGVTKLGKIKYRGVERYAENLRKMFVAMASDVRVIFIKFADRVDNLKTLGSLPEEKQKRIANETLQIYTQIAHRFDMREFRVMMEDIAFYYAMPEEYEQTKKLFESRIPEASKNVQIAIQELENKLRESHIPFIKIYGRTKHLYSLYHKLHKYNNDIERIYDLIALRIICKTVGECYQILGAVHSIWKPIPGRLKDFIATPKPNGYQSIHTTVFLGNGYPLECQIRTEEMHVHSEFGIAAHFTYKDKRSKDGTWEPLPQHAEWINRLSEWQSKVKENEEFLEDIKLDFFTEHIFVFTPRGDAVDLPEDATPIDFAYHIHSDIGNSCVGVYINQEIRPLDTPLKSGDVVEIIVDKNRKTPSEEWVKIAKTHEAREHIRAALNKQRRNFIQKLFTNDRKPEK